MALRHFSARGLIAVLAVGLLAAACNPDPGSTPTESPSSTASAPPSATPSPTRTETAQEQKQREAFEAAEKAYRTNFAEVGRLAMKGGVEEPTAVLKATSKGVYLDIQMQALRSLASDGARVVRYGEIVWVHPGGFSGSELVLNSCEDYSKVMLINESGETAAPENSEGRIAKQTITAVRSGGGWKLSDLDSEQVSRC